MYTFVLATEGVHEDKTSQTLGVYLLSETPMEYTLYQSLFDREVPYRPTYIPQTTLAK